MQYYMVFRVTALPYSGVAANELVGFSDFVPSATGVHSYHRVVSGTATLPENILKGKTVNCQVYEVDLVGSGGNWKPLLAYVSTSEVVNQFD